MNTCRACGRTVENTQLVNGHHYCQDCFDTYFITCSSCGEVVSRLYATASTDGRPFCSECYTREFVRCNSCRREHPRSATHEYNGRFYCAECRAANFVTCPDCGREVYIRDAFRYNDTHYCHQCFNTRYRRCDQCGHYHPVADMHPVHTNLCNACFQQHYFTCSRCNRVSNRSEMVTRNDGSVLCGRCAIRPVIHQYGFRPTPVFFGGAGEDGGRYYGTEIEIDGGGEDNTKARKFYDIANAQSDHIYIKHDGSLSNGMELVSMPATLEYHKNNIPWEAVMKKALRLGYTSHDAGSCGVHFHVSKRAFGATIEEQDSNIMKLLFVVERFWNELVRFSRRTSDSLDRWARRYHIYEPDQLLAHAKVGPRYAAVNVQPPATVELRMFRGTLRYGTFIAILQLIDSMMDLILGNDIETIKNVTWATFVAGLKPEHTELHEYLRIRRLAPSEGVTILQRLTNAEEIAVTDSALASELRSNGEWNQL